MNEQHTPEPWFIENHTPIEYPTICAKGIRLFSVNGAYAEGNAARIIACINALSGIPNPAEWVEDMKTLERGFNEWFPNGGFKALQSELETLKKERDELRGGFSKGYACAVATIINAHRETALAKDVFEGNFMDFDEMKEIGIADEDIKVLTPIVKEILRKRELTKGE